MSLDRTGAELQGMDVELLVNWYNRLPPVSKGGPGSGNFGHSGRPGHRGGSAPADRRAAYFAMSWEEFQDAAAEKARTFLVEEAGFKPKDILKVTAIPQPKLRRFFSPRWARVKVTARGRPGSFEVWAEVDPPEDPIGEGEMRVYFPTQGQLSMGKP